MEDVSFDGTTLMVNGEEVKKVDPLQDTTNTPREKYGAILKRMTADYLVFRETLERVARIDPRYSPFEDKTFDDIVKVIRDATDDEKRLESTLSKFVKSVHVSLSVVDAVVDKKWYYIYTCLDNNVCVKHDDHQDKLFVKYMDYTKNTIAQMGACDLILAADANPSVTELEQLHSAFEKDYHDLNLLITSLQTEVA